MTTEVFRQWVAELRLPLIRRVSGVSLGYNGFVDCLTECQTDCFVDCLTECQTDCFADCLSKKDQKLGSFLF